MVVESKLPKRAIRIYISSPFIWRRHKHALCRCLYQPIMHARGKYRPTKTSPSPDFIRNRGIDAGSAAFARDMCSMGQMPRPVMG